MRYFLTCFVLFALGGSAFAQSATGPTEPDYLYAATVGRVIDGHTLELEIDLGFDTRLMRQRFRFADAEAPAPQGRTQPAGIAARDFLRGLVAGKAVIIKPLIGPEGEDIQDDGGRWVGYVYLDGLDVGQHMIQSGFADASDR